MHDGMVIYRSRSAQYSDEFWYDIFWPWVYGHWGYVVAGLCALLLTLLIINARSNKRRYY